MNKNDHNDDDADDELTSLLNAIIKRLNTSVEMQFVGQFIVQRLPLAVMYCWRTV